jgi:putative oxidoreductase
MKYLPTIASILLGLLFLMASVTFFLHMVPDEKIVEGTPKAMFMGAFGPTGYMAFVKICELVGAILVLIPRTRNFGLLVLGPVIVNILAYGCLIDKSALNPITFAVAALALYLLWVGRRAFAGLLN